jgi:cold shock CspA family protein
MTDSNKYIGIVKWFHDQTREANYGFIQHAKLGDIFFHEKSTSGGQNISLFRQDAIVVFNTQESKKHEGKLEAINIRILDTESDVIYLFEQLLIVLAEKSEYSYYDLINISLLNNIKKLLESQVDVTKVQELFNLFSTQINKNKGTELLNDLGYLKSLLKVGVQLFPGLYNQIAQQVEEIASVPIAYKLWVDGLLNKFHYEYVASIMLDEPDPIKQTIYDRCTPNDLEQLFDTFKQHIIEIIKTNITAKEFNEILRVSKVFFTESFKEIQRIVENHISAELAHEFWLKGFLDTCQVEYIATILASEPDQSKEKIFNRCSENDLEQLYAAFKNNLIKVISSNITEKEIENLLRTTRRFFANNYEQITGIVENNISTEVAHKLWLDSFIETCQINHVANIILHETQSIKERIFDRCSDEDKINIFFRIIFVLEHIDTDFKLATVENSLKLAKEFVPGQYERILIGIINICPDHYKLSLWLNDYHDILDFDAYKILTITLNPNDQKKFVKKVLKKIHEGSLQVEIDAFTSINLIDFETSEKYAQYENAHLDYSTSVVLNVISELHGQKKLSTLKDEELAQHKIYDLVLKQIKDPKDILRITGYFDECEGRCSVSFRK